MQERKVLLIFTSILNEKSWKFSIFKSVLLLKVEWPIQNSVWIGHGVAPQMRHLIQYPDIDVVPSLKKSCKELLLSPFEMAIMQKAHEQLPVYLLLQI